MQTMNEWLLLLAIVVAIGAIGWAGFRWGADSRDGRDWRAQNRTS